MLQGQGYSLAQLETPAGAPGGFVAVAPGSGNLVVVSKALVQPPNDARYVCILVRDGQSTQVGYMHFDGDLATWAGPVTDPVDLGLSGDRFVIQLDTPDRSPYCRAPSEVRGRDPTASRMSARVTLGLDDGWRRQAVMEAALRPGDSVIDVGCGDGRLTAMLAERVGPFGRVEGVDDSRIARGFCRRHATCAGPGALPGRPSSQSLPFESGTFDAATMAFGLRSLPDIGAGLRELVRVVRPGGRVVILELALPRGRSRRAAWCRLCRSAAPLLAHVVGGDSAIYRSLPDALATFPTPVALGLLMTQSGLSDVTRGDLGPGIASLHRGTVRYAGPAS